MNKKHHNSGSITISWKSPSKSGVHDMIKTHTTCVHENTSCTHVIFHMTEDTGVFKYSISSLYLQTTMKLCLWFYSVTINLGCLMERC